MGIFISADKSQSLYEVLPENGRNFKLAQLYALLSCDMIEILPIADGLMSLTRFGSRKELKG